MIMLVAKHDDSEDENADGLSIFSCVKCTSQLSFLYHSVLCVDVDVYALYMCDSML